MYIQEDQTRRETKSGREVLILSTKAVSGECGDFPEEERFRRSKG
jgi:hypothetical protein